MFFSPAAARGIWKSPTSTWIFISPLRGELREEGRRLPVAEEAAPLLRTEFPVAVGGDDPHLHGVAGLAEGVVGRVQLKPDRNRRGQRNAERLIGQRRGEVDPAAVAFRADLRPVAVAFHFVDEGAGIAVDGQPNREPSSLRWG